MALVRQNRAAGCECSGLAAVGAVILQGILGGLRVTMLKRSNRNFSCLSRASFLLALMVIIALVNSRFWREHVAAIRDGELLPGDCTLTTVLIYVQLALACHPCDINTAIFLSQISRPPTANGFPILVRPQSQRLMLLAIASECRTFPRRKSGYKWRIVSVPVLVAIGVIWFFVSVHREKILAAAWAFTAWLIGVFVQLGLGAWTIWSNKAADVATTHVAVGATMLWPRCGHLRVLLSSNRNAGFSDPSTKIGSGHRMKGADLSECQASAASAAPTRVSDFSQLIKTRLTFLVLITTGVGFYLGSFRFSRCCSLSERPAWGSAWQRRVHLPLINGGNATSTP